MGQKWVKPFNIFAREIVNGIRKSGIKVINFEMIAEKYLPIFLSCAMSLKVMG